MCATGEQQKHRQGVETVRGAAQNNPQPLFCTLPAAGLSWSCTPELGRCLVWGFLCFLRHCITPRVRAGNNGSSGLSTSPWYSCSGNNRVLRSSWADFMPGVKKPELLIQLFIIIFIKLQVCSCSILQHREGFSDFQCEMFVIRSCLCQHLWLGALHDTNHSCCRGCSWNLGLGFLQPAQRMETAKSLGWAQEGEED